MDPKIDSESLFLSIFEHKIDSKAYMAIYTDIYNACTKNSQHGKYVYEALTKFLQEKMKEIQLKWHKNPPTPVLVQYLDFFAKYRISAKFYHHIMDYLNRHWIKRELDEGKPIYDINTTCLIHFRTYLFEPCKTELLSEVKQLLHDFRQQHISQVSKTGPSIDPSDHNRLVNQLSQLVQSILLFCMNDQSYYHNEFIVPYKEWMSQYSLFYDQLFAAPDFQLQQYMSHCLSVLEWEYNLINTCFSSLFPDELKDQLHTLLIVNYKQSIIKQLPFYLSTVNHNGLHMSYTLLNTINYKQPLYDVVYSSIFDHLQNNAFDATTSTTDITTHYMQSYDYYMAIMSAFNNDSGCIASLDRAFTQHLNSIPNVPELLAKQTDSVLKKGIDVEIMQSTCKQSLILFKYIHDKDVFYKYYSRGLAKRLLFAQSLVDMEQWMIGQLKELCGFEYTSKLQRLYSEFMTSKTLINDLNLGSSAATSILGDLVVVSTATWPLLMPKETIQLPLNLQDTLNGVQEQYQLKHSGRKLVFMHTHSRCELKYNKYLLTCSVFQSSALMLFSSDKESITVGQMIDQLQLSIETLIQHLGILFRAKLLLGIRVPTDQLTDALEGVTRDTIISINKDFTSKKIRLNLFQFLKMAVDPEEVVNMDQDRSLVIQACLVRIMKSRKQLKYVVVVNEVIQQLTNKFKPNIGMIKKCIDSLIEKDYLKRDDEDSNTLVYLA